MAAADRDAKLFLSGVVLAAGGSSRMGRAKQLLPLDGKPILQHVIDNALASSLDEIVVVLGSAADEISGALELPSGSAVGRLRVVVNEDWESGQSRSLIRGLRACDERADGAAFLLGDQPRLPGALIERVRTAFAEADRARTPFVRPVFVAGGSQVPGHPVLAARCVWPELERLRGDAGARELIAARPERLVQLRVDEAAPADLDTPADYRREGA